MPVIGENEKERFVWDQDTGRLTHIDKKDTHGKVWTSTRTD